MRNGEPYASKGCTYGSEGGQRYPVVDRATGTGSRALPYFFDNIDHRILIELLEKKIDDHRFVGLIKMWLQAGYVDDWVFHKTYSGTPQGGIISPILANVYLHELDRYVEEMQKSFNRGKKRSYSPEYARLNHLTKQCRKKIDAIKDDPSQKEELARLQQNLDELLESMHAIPSQDMVDPNFRRLQFCRYADDFIIGIIGSRKDAERVMEQVKFIITSLLNLEMNEDKTKIRHITEGCRYLGYEIRQVAGEKLVKAKVNGRHTVRRSTSGIVSLFVPDDVAPKFCQAHGYGDYQSTMFTHRTNLIALSELEIINTYNAELRGLAEYYALASNVKTKLTKLFYMGQSSLFKTLANKRKTSLKAITERLRAGGEFIYRYEAKGERKECKVFWLKHLLRKSRAWQAIDSLPKTVQFTLSRTELLSRLNAGRCEFCGKEGDCEVHHVRKLKDLLRKREKSLLERMMIARRRKTMVLCTDCHDRLHTGTLPDIRYATT